VVALAALLAARAVQARESRFKTGGPGFRVGVDWLWGLGRLHRHPKFNLDLYFGVGLILDFLLALRLLV
jgi:hypothetical protein